MFAGVEPKFAIGPNHRMAVLAYDGVVLGDLVIPLEIVARVRNAQGKSCYDVRVCGATGEVQSEYARLMIPWRLSSVARADTVIIARQARMSTRHCRGVSWSKWG